MLEYQPLLSALYTSNLVVHIVVRPCNFNRANIELFLQIILSSNALKLLCIHMFIERLLVHQVCLLFGWVARQCCQLVPQISKDKNRLLKVCYVSATSAGLPGLLFLLRPLIVLMRQTRQVVCAINQSILLRCLWRVPSPWVLSFLTQLA